MYYQLYIVTIKQTVSDSYTYIYCIEIWGISTQTDLNPLLLMQKKLIIIMTFTSYHAHTAPIFRDLEILTIDKLIVHRIGYLPEVLNAIYRKNSEIHSYNTRSKDMFQISSGTQTF